MLIKESKNAKILCSKDYNYIFNKNNGAFLRWGNTVEEDPTYCSYGPEIADIEIVAGKCSGNCSFCYKINNLATEKNIMSLDAFKLIFDKLPKTLTQIAFGITDIYANPDFFKIMEYAKNNGVIPNYTTSGNDLDDFAVSESIRLCGAVAVSIVNKEKSYNAIYKLTQAGLKQCNIHYMLSDESYENAFKLIDDIKTDERLKNINAIVFLQYKDKNPNAKFHSINDVNKYKKLIEYCENKNISYGFDSCSAGIFLKSITDRKDKDKLEQCVDSCESMRMSIYINVDGIVFPCSFCEDVADWKTGIDMLQCKDFLTDVWNNEKTVKWRNGLINSMTDGCAKCLIYNINNF